MHLMGDSSVSESSRPTGDRTSWSKVQAVDVGNKYRWTTSNAPQIGIIDGTGQGQKPPVANVAMIPDGKLDELYVQDGTRKLGSLASRALERVWETL